MDAEIRSLFLDAVRIARDVMASPAVGTAWDTPSALRRFSVGGLCGHLARAAFTVREYLLESSPAGVPLPGAAAYFAATLTQDGADDIDSPMHVAIRRRGEERAADGQAATVERVDQVHSWLIDALLREPPGRTMQVIRGQTMLLDDYLETRLVELALHVDDVCVSVATPTPAVPGSNLAIATLVSVARELHGDVAVLRALGRRERDQGNALRVF